MYHSVAGRMTDGFRDFTVTADRLAEHLAALRDGGWQTITLSEAAAQLRRPDHDQRRRLVALTFDDAYADFATHAMPALAAARAKATLFVPTAHVGRRAGWLPGNEAARPLLGWSDLADAGGAGVEIGSHGHEHAPLDLGRPDGIYEDLRRSRLILEDQLGRAITTLAYPYGYQTGKTRHAARDAGFHTACAVVGLPATATDGQLALPRLAVTQDMRGDDLLALLTRRPRPAQRRLRRGKQHLWYAARKTRLIAPRSPASKDDRR
ncbi:polysaccharide deacetylase family protein [Actinoplanes sp. TBRC 11911]|uniref:polysaccharide deacetylase family protein n=1 Tax=Actinoplanes sp. TBRC 11911 TaxID=2729386 RepID=UPI00145F0447|nr:polysaccharide deacetylase family protein [Actinoplanes sp. TBRC 11911]NMO52873.1 polysaccharide deacetylase family protein [Actinoplanes sp. TBRC 11911]